MNKDRRKFLCHFRPRLERAVIFEAAWKTAKISLSLKPNHNQVKLVKIPDTHCIKASKGRLFINNRPAKVKACDKERFFSKVYQNIKTVPVFNWYSCFSVAMPTHNRIKILAIHPSSGWKKDSPLDNEEKETNKILHYITHKKCIPCLLLVWQSYVERTFFI